MKRRSCLASVAVTVLMSACSGPSSKHDEVLRPPGDPEVQAVLAEIAGASSRAYSGMSGAHQSFVKRDEQSS
ncbi:hypothetical protein [Burkholderia sp. LMG 21824]|uniref:hypothetical protein n=1 Tax=Burkholderia sp. LMG 21824 TaxID=3158172 RepID=UPI003C2BA5C7